MPEREPDIHYDNVIMTMVASQITSLTIVYSTVYSDTVQRKHQSSASLAFVWGIHRDRWIPRTKGQLRGIFFHLMTSSWESQQTPIPLTLTSELWGVYCEDLGENWPRHIGTALYNFTMCMVKLYIYIYIYLTMTKCTNDAKVNIPHINNKTPTVSNFDD